MLKRTHTCGELTPDDVGKTVVLNGWVDAWRDFGGLVFIDVRDRYGLTQVVFEPEAGADLQAAARELRNEYVVGVEGVVARRLPGKENPRLKTGAIEVRGTKLEVMNPSPTPPFEINGPEPNEELRLKYRYLDLRRPAMQEVFLIRHRMAQLMRNTMSDLGFLEFETPMLGRSTPEGARDFLVPSRVHAGHFYALPQSPQLYKQLLMVSGFDRYFQIARCFRDEDLRANRQPEFTQLDVEMSFVEFEDVLGTMEGLVAAIAKEFSGQELTLPVPRIEHDDAMERFGNDRPDLRYDLELKDVADLAAETEFKVFQVARDNAHRIRGLCAPGGGTRYSRKDLDGLTEYAAEFGSKGLVWLKVEADSLTGPTAKFFNADLQARLRERFDAKAGDLILIVADSQAVTSQALSNLRIRLASELKLYDPKSFHYSWVVRFPLLHWDAEEEPIRRPSTIRSRCRFLRTCTCSTPSPRGFGAQAYDPRHQRRGGRGRDDPDSRLRDPGEGLRRLLGLTPEQAEEKFGFLLGALPERARRTEGSRLAWTGWSCSMPG